MFDVSFERREFFNKKKTFKASICNNKTEPLYHQYKKYFIKATFCPNYMIDTRPSDSAPTMKVKKKMMILKLQNQK